MVPLRYASRDRLAYLILFGYLALIILLRIIL